jgi:hypothetical protein
MFEFLFRSIDLITAWFKRFVNDWFGSAPESQVVKSQTNPKPQEGMKPPIFVSVPGHINQEIKRLILGMSQEDKATLEGLPEEQKLSFWSDVQNQYDHQQISYDIIIRLLEEKARCGGAGRGGALMQQLSNGKKNQGEGSTAVVSHSMFKKPDPSPNSFVLPNGKII